MSFTELDDVLIDIRDKIGYIRPILTVSILMLIVFASIQIFFEINSNNFQSAKIVIYTLMILFSLLLIIPLKILNTIYDKTKVLGQKIFVNNMFEGLLQIDYLNKNMNEKIFEIITKGMPQFSNATYSGKQKISNYEFDVFQNSPPVSFPARLWNTKEVVFAKYFPGRIVSEIDLKEMYDVIKKSKQDKLKSVKIFCIGDDFEPIFSKNEHVREITKLSKITHYLTILKHTDSGFEIMWIGNNHQTV